MADTAGPLPSVDPQGLHTVAEEGEGRVALDIAPLQEPGDHRFRQSLGGLIEAYEAVARRLGVQLD